MAVIVGRDPDRTEADHWTAELDEATVAAFRSTLHEPAAVRWHGITAYALCGWHWFSKVLPRMIAFPIEERAAHVQARTLIVRGEYDAMVPR
ncbi:alpha/beta hydrolase, partial [Bacillus sp. S34]|nr:alpha/beta hydrolase [Bacillus sp. S34]